MLERMRDPGTHQAFQHFIANARWSADAVWRHLRDTIPGRTGFLTREDSFPKQRPHSVAVARHYCDELGKIAQLSDGGDRPLQASMLGATLYLPLVADAGAAHRGRIPAGVRTQW